MNAIANDNPSRKEKKLKNKNDFLIDNVQQNKVIKQTQLSEIATKP